MDNEIIMVTITLMPVPCKLLVLHRLNHLYKLLDLRLHPMPNEHPVPEILESYHLRTDLEMIFLLLESHSNLYHLCGRNRSSVLCHSRHHNRSQHNNESSNESNEKGRDEKGRGSKEREIKRHPALHSPPPNRCPPIRHRQPILPMVPQVLL
jgi:hypothetical protein